jgi:RimJ/RimL family protein N-acetyltransferase
MSARLETDRLVLRRPELSDAPVITALINDRDIAANLLHVDHPYPDGMAEQWIQNVHESEGDGLSFRFVITRKADRQLIGSIGIHRDMQHQRGETGYWLGKAYWGQGCATEALRRVIQFGFEQLSLNRIQASYFVHNPASARVMEKAGMTFEFIMRQHYFKWGQCVDTGLYSILRADWEGQ